MRALRKRGMFFRFLVSYLLALMLPILLLTVLVFQYYLSQMEGQIVSDSRESLEAVVEAVNLQVDQINAYSVLSQVDMDFSGRNLAENYSAFYDVADTLGKWKFTNSFLSDIFFYNRETAKFYATDAVYNTAAFLEYGCGFLLPSYYLEQTLRESTSPRWITAESSRSVDGEPVIAYIIPVKRTEKGSESALFCTVAPQSLEQIVTGSSMEGGILLVDAASLQPIFSSGDSAAIPLDNAFFARLAAAENGELLLKPAETGGDQYLLCRYSPTARMHFVNIIHVDQMRGPIRDMRTIFLVGVFCIVLISSLLIAMLLRYNYAPIRKLGTLASGMVPAPELSGNEIDAAYHALLVLARTKEEVLSDSAQLRREQALTRLLGGYPDAADDLDRRDVLGNCTTACRFRVVMIHPDHPDGLGGLDTKGIIEGCTAALSEGFAAFGVEYAEIGSVVLILKAEASGEGAWAAEIAGIDRYLEGAVPSPYYLGVGNLCTGLREVSRSYLEARIAVRKAAEAGERLAIYQMGMEGQQHGSLLLPENLLQDLPKAMGRGDTVQAGRILEHMLALMASSENATYALSFFLLILHVTGSGKAVRPECHGKYVSFVLNSGADPDFEGVLEMARSFKGELLAGLAPPEETEAERLGGILQYIDANFMDPDFYARSVADAFGMSVSNLSHYFKNRMGITISEYCNDLKIKRAKELLRNTDLPIASIAEQVGYLQLSSFMRKFRQMANMTPGEYRDSSRKQDHSQAEPHSSGKQ